MTCPKCNNENARDAVFCETCGYSLHSGVVAANVAQYSTGTIYMNHQKNTIIGIILTIIWPGLGHLYARKFMKGLVLMGVYILLIILSPFTFLISGITAILLWLWMIFDVRNTIKEYNIIANRTGTPPW